METDRSRGSWRNLILPGLVAGAIINVIEWLVHRFWLYDRWVAAFAAFGKNPLLLDAFRLREFLGGNRFHLDLSLAIRILRTDAIDGAQGGRGNVDRLLGDTHRRASAVRLFPELSPRAGDHRRHRRRCARNSARDLLVRSDDRTAIVSCSINSFERHIVPRSLPPQ